VLWPQGFSGHFDIVAAFITVAAFIALFRFNINVLYVIFASALVGLAVAFF
jgi:chromate transporter